NRFLQDSGSSTILVLVDRGVTFPLAADDGANNWRPPQEDGVCNMKNIMVPISIAVRDVVREPGAEINAVAPKQHFYSATTATFHKFQRKAARDLFLFRK